MLLFWVSMGLVYDFSTKISVSLISQQAPKRSFNRFGFVLILDNLRAICLTAAFNFFNNQKICKKCDLTRPSKMILVNPFRFESSFNIGCPLKIWTENLKKSDSFSSKRCQIKMVRATDLHLVLNGRYYVIVCWSSFIF